MSLHLFFCGFGSVLGFMLGWLREADRARALLHRLCSGSGGGVGLRLACAGGGTRPLQCHTKLLTSVKIMDHACIHGIRRADFAYEALNNKDYMQSVDILQVFPQVGADAARLGLKP